MGRGKDLSSEEQGRISGRSVSGCCIAKIAQNINRSRKAVSGYINNLNMYGTKRKNVGRKPKIKP